MEEEGEIGTEDERMGEMDIKQEPSTPPIKDEEEDEEEEEETKADKTDDDFDVNVTDSQVMIQLKEAEEEAAALRKEIAELRREVDDYQCRGTLTEEDEEHLQEIQLILMEKMALLDELTKRIAKLMEIAGKRQKSEDTTILDEEEEEEGFPDDLLPKVVICSSWDDMMPKVVVCMDMKKPGAAKKKAEDDRDENGLSPEQREALEQERRCMAEERNRLQYQIACMEGEMRVMMRENDMLSRKVAQLKADMENQPPFEFEMSVSATNPPGCGAPKPGNMDMGYGVMGPNANGAYTVGGAVAPGGEMQGRLSIQPPPPQLPPAMFPGQRGCCQGYPQQQGYPQNGYPQPQNGYQQPQSGYPQPQNGYQNGNGGRKQLPCGGITGTPGKSVPCPKLQPQEPQPQQQSASDWPDTLPPYGKKCRKDFNAAQGGGCCGGNVAMSMMSQGGFNESSLPLGMLKPPPMDVNFKVNVQPQSGPCDKRVSMDTDSRSNKIAQQLQEIEMELKRMQRDLCKAKNDKETLKAQQDTLNCAKNFIM